jgi:hypothetical protein
MLIEEDDNTFITECLPIEIKRGDGAPIMYQHYEIKLNPKNNGTIKDVYNNALSCPVKFKAIAID